MSAPVATNASNQRFTESLRWSKALSYKLWSSSTAAETVAAAILTASTAIGRAATLRACAADDT